MRREREKVVPKRSVAPSDSVATDQLAVFAQSRPCIREGNEMN